ncbi:MAG: biotin/lipoyl-binding protein [Bacteroidetes bacterium]|nr:biotin/lipoyl-binding protein [Bacteroidota bacterium]
MYQLTINDDVVISAETDKEGVYTLNSKTFSPDIIKIREGVFHVISSNKSYTAEVIKHDPVEKTFHIRVNANSYKVQVRDKYDVLLKELGLDALNAKKITDLKAPMPGLVVEVVVEEGQQVKMGDKMIVLEAMKMENILKAPGDAVIKKVNVSKGNTVEKNEVLILFS